jgi:hypothetical protein
MFESRHVSRHFERRKRDGEAASPGTTAYKAKIRDTVRNLPKLSLVVASGCHLVLAACASTGCCSDHVQAKRVIVDAWLRAPVKRFVADAGYDAPEDAQAGARRPGL